MSSRSRFVEVIIANSIGTATRPHGGQNLDWIRLPPLEHFGWNRIRCRRRSQSALQSRAHLSLLVRAPKQGLGGQVQRWC